MAKRTCSVEGCDKPEKARRRCSAHYEQWRKQADDSEKEPFSPAQRVERFWSRVQKLDNGCWEWTGSRRQGSDYGLVGIGDNLITSTHRYAWTIAIGPIPDGLWVLHRCDNPPCVNPSHLFLGTRAVNMADMLSKGRGNNQKKTHCVHGHAFDEENTRWAQRGDRVRRVCRACMRRHVHNHRRRKTAS